MFKYLTPALLMIAFVTGCKKNSIATNVPPCIDAEIKKIENDTHPYIREVVEYFFEGKTVYAFEPDEHVISDAPTVIKDSTCNNVCSVGGYGISDVTRCNGVKFYDNAMKKRVIWEKK